MRSPEEQERFLTSGRFERESAKDGRLSAGILAAFALLYWAIAAAAFLVNFELGFWVTLPWSYLIVSLRMQLSPTNPIVGFIVSKEGGLILYAFLGGGLNILLVFAFARLLARSTKTTHHPKL